MESELYDSVIDVATRYEMLAQAVADVSPGVKWRRPVETAPGPSKVERKVGDRHNRAERVLLVDEAFGSYPFFTYGSAYRPVTVGEDGKTLRIERVARPLDNVQTRPGDRAAGCARQRAPMPPNAVGVFVWNNDVDVGAHAHLASQAIRAQTAPRQWVPCVNDVAYLADQPALRWLIVQSSRGVWVVEKTGQPVDVDLYADDVHRTLRALDDVAAVRSYLQVANVRLASARLRLSFFPLPRGRTLAIAQADDQADDDNGQ